MSELQLYLKLSSLPFSLRSEVADFIDSLKVKQQKIKQANKRSPGKAKGLLEIKDNFDDPIEGFSDYTL